MLYVLVNLNARINKNKTQIFNNHVNNIKNNKNKIGRCWTILLMRSNHKLPIIWLEDKEWLNKINNKKKQVTKMKRMVSKLGKTLTSTQRRSMISYPNKPSQWPHNKLNSIITKCVKISWSKYSTQIQITNQPITNI